MSTIIELEMELYIIDVIIMNVTSNSQRGVGYKKGLDRYGVSLSEMGVRGGRLQAMQEEWTDTKNKVHSRGTMSTRLESV